ncbi:MAG TPA: hypothetical protein DCL80_04010 [Balneola sp.]|jgi:hypothetical protein|nr:hypothetical protein [Balneola sp.]MAO78273.1 hypothetical protein [Balneola sp.]MBF64274.1 hypothetical protein [Balneola sp.]HAH50459.1 hypothetical protein [Balneola sp.]HAW80669.1 hypothetical protein [Balneola sp.]
MNRNAKNLPSMRNRQLGNTKINYGETLFKVLFIVFLTLGISATFIALFIEEYFSIILTIGVNTILFSFLFKFMESVILLLKGIKKELQNND